MATAVNYVKGAELPPLTIQFLDDNNAVIDMSAATFSLKLGLDTSTTALTKTSGITGGSNGASVAWSSGELDLTPGTYLGQLTATIGGLDYRRQFTLVIEPSLA